MSTSAEPERSPRRRRLILLLALAAVGLVAIELLSWWNTPRGPLAEMLRNGTWDIPWGDPLGSSRIHMTLHPDGRLTWTTVNPGQTSTFEGRWRSREDVLILDGSTVQQVAAFLAGGDGRAHYRITKLSEDSFTMRLLPGGVPGESSDPHDDPVVTRLSRRSAADTSQ